MATTEDFIAKTGAMWARIGPFEASSSWGSGTMRGVRKALQRDTHLSSPAACGFRSKAVNAYAAKVSSFLDLLMALCHLLGGMPARDTELTSLKLRNSWASMRSFYIIDGVVMFLGQWEKNQSSINAPKLIPRFLSSCIGQMFIAYLADVQPFLSYLQYSKKFPLTAS